MPAYPPPIRRSLIDDHGVSGVATRLADRPEGRRLSVILRTGDVLVVRWLDRLGRNDADVTDTVREFLRRGVIIRPAEPDHPRGLRPIDRIEAAKAGGDRHVGLDDPPRLPRLAG